MRRLALGFALLGAGCGGRTPPVAVAAASDVYSIAVGAGDVVWVEDGSRIVQAPKTGGTREILVDHEDGVRSVTVSGSTVSWTRTLGNEAGIRMVLSSVPLQGGKESRHVTRFEAGGPITATADGSVYWAGRNDDTFELSRFHDGRIDVLASWSGNLENLSAVSADGDGIAWAERGEIHRAGARGDGDVVIARDANEISAVVSGGGGRIAWLEKEWECDVIPNQAASPPRPPPSIWDRVERALGREPLTGTPAPGRKIHVLTDGAPFTIDAGMPQAIAADADGIVWVDAGNPMSVSSGGFSQAGPCDELVPILGTARLMESSWDGRTRVVDRDDFDAAVAIDEQWIYVASRSKGLERLAR